MKAITGYLCWNCGVYVTYDTPHACDTDEPGPHDWRRGRETAHEDEARDTGHYYGGYRTFRNGTEREDFGGDR